MIYASFIAVILFHIVLFSRRGLLDPISVFFLAFLYYCYFTPISMSAFNQYDVFLAGSTYYIDQRTIDQSSILFFLGYMAYGISYFVITKNSGFNIYAFNNFNMFEIFNDYFSKVIIFSILILTAVIVVIFPQEFLTATSSYSGKISGNYESSNYSFTIGLALTLLSLFTNYVVLNINRYYLATFSFVILFGVIALVTFSKAPFIYAALCVFCFLYRYKKLSYAITLSTLILGSVIGTIFIIPAFSSFRATGEFAIAIPDSNSLSSILSEASGPFSIVHLAINGYVSADGHPLWQSFALWVPRSIWADRPIDIAEGFARQMIIEWQSGFGLGFSPFAEGYARYGLWGSTLFMGMMGAVTAVIQSIFARAVPASMRVPAMLTIGGLVSVLVLRGAFSGLITVSLQNWVPIVLIFVLMRYLARNRSKKSGTISSFPTSIAK
jgi:hypothetical protein